MIRKRRLGRTNLMVSEISLGTVELGMDYGIRPAGEDARPGEAEAARLLHGALEAGINFIDTARLYGDSEAIIGRALKGRRAEFVLESKVPAFLEEGFRGQVLRERVVTSVQESLRALATDVIDILMIHSAPAGVIVQDEVREALEGLRQAGCIRFIGASVYGEEAAIEAIRSGHYDCLQIAYSMLDRRPEACVLPEARAADVGIVVRSVLLKGALTHRYRDLPDALAPLKEAVERMAALAGGAVENLPELAYRYVLAHPVAHTALVGTARMDEIEAAVRYAQRGPLPEDLLARIREIAVDDEAQLNPANWPI